MATTFNWIYLGFSNTTLDPTEGNTTAENASALVGSTFGSVADPLLAHVTSATMIDNGGTAGVLDQNNTLSNDQFTTDIGNGTQTFTFDSSVIYNATITYANGTTATVTAVIAQDTTGHLFLAPEFTNNADTTAYEAGGIRSITFNSLNGDTFSGMTADRIVTGFDDGYVEGTSGNDLINNSYVEPTANGSDRVDNNDALLPGMTGNDDYIRAGAGNDTVVAGNGNDIIDGGTGNDSMTGGNGDDTFLLSGTYGNDTIIGSEGGETNGDLIDGSALTGNSTVTFTGGEAGTYTTGANTATFSQIERFRLGSGNDTVNGAASTLSMNVDGGAGADSMTGGSANDTLTGGAGNDTLNGGGGADSLVGGDGDDTFNLTGTFGNDTIVGGEAGETAGDTLSSTGVTTNTTLTFTGNEAGTLSDGTSTAGFSEIEHFRLGSGNDTVNASAATAGVDVDGGAGNDSMTGGSGNDTLSGGTGADTINGGAGADSLSGGDGDDTFNLTGTFGNDTIVGGEAGETAGDTINASTQTANTTLTFTGGEAGTLSAGGSTATFSQIERFTLGSGNDTVNGAASTLSMNVDGGAGADSMTGGSANDTLIGGAGNDTLNGGAGADSLVGGDGDDTFVLANNFGNDTIVGGEGAETAGDTINATAVTQNTTLNYTANEAGTISAGGSTAGFSQVEHVRLGSGNDVVNASATTQGVDVDGGAGNDSMTGGSGNDTLSGGTGADTLTGGAGNDTLSLGAGDGANDLVVLSDGSGNDVITGFEGPVQQPDGSYVGRDLLDVTALQDAGGGTIQPWDVTVTDTNGDGTGNAILTFPNGETVTLVGILPSQVDSPAELRAIGIPCFTAGTMIATPAGEAVIETLREGDEVLTLDHGVQRLRWIGRRKVAATGTLAPVFIPAGALGNLRDLRVSPQHRMLISGWQAELYFGEAEVLVAAKHLVGRDGIRLQPGGEVEYVHILFDRHEIVIADGAPSESFHPGDQGLGALEAAARDEVMQLFPGLRARGWQDYGPAARRCLTAREARLVQTPAEGDDAVFPVALRA